MRARKSVLVTLTLALSSACGNSSDPHDLQPQGGAGATATGGGGNAQSGSNGAAAGGPGASGSGGTEAGSGGEADGLTTVPGQARLASFGPGVCALNSAGRVVCWGSNPSGPWDLPTTPFKSLAAAGLVCGLAVDQSVTCVVPPGLTDDPSRVPKDDLLQLVMSGTGSCWVDTDNRAHCDAVLRTPADTQFSQISTGWYFACGIRSSDEQVQCWGNAESMLGCEPGIPATGQLAAPAGTFRQISSNAYQSCGVREDGTLACWGAGEPTDDPEEMLCDTKLNYGQATPPSGTFSQVSVGISHACAVRTNGTLACWGAGKQAGDCAAGIDGCGQSATPVDGGFVEVLAANSNSCGMKSDGKVRCWGSNTFGRSTPPAELQ